MPRLSAAADTARGALAAFETHLRDVVLPASDGEGRLGAGAVRRQDAPHDALRDAHAGADPGRSRARVRRRSGPRWSGSPATCGRPGARIAPLPDDEAALVRGVLDAIAADHPAADDLLDFCREENARIEAFCRERDLIGLAEEPLEIRWTPVFLRSFGGAMLISPGPLDKGQKAFFAITPMPDDWTDEQRESYLREDNDRMLRLLTHPRGRARPLPAGRLREPLPVARPGRSSRAGCSPRAGPSTSPR